MNTSRHTLDEIMEYAYRNDIELGFLTAAELKEFEKNPFKLLVLILQIMERDE